MVAHASIPTIWETEAGGLPVRDQPGLHNKYEASLSQKNKLGKKKSSFNLLLTMGDMTGQEAQLVWIN